MRSREMREEVTERRLVVVLGSFLCVCFYLVVCLLVCISACVSVSVCVLQQSVSHTDRYFLTSIYMYMITSPHLFPFNISLLQYEFNYLHTLLCYLNNLSANNLCIHYVNIIFAYTMCIDHLHMICAYNNSSDNHDDINTWLPHGEMICFFEERKHEMLVSGSAYYYYLFAYQIYKQQRHRAETDSRDRQ
eukprot:GHVQ01042420.1.p1 GENE.GHVQ01042420.1~~GHVQ01042420.1.p1  ORF type:complete len:190 (+),score=27.75 GHVQ01042420.1:1050-1619(+)